MSNYDEDNLTTAVDPDILPENEPTLYKNNLFYTQFAQIVDETETYFYNHNEKVINSYFNPSFLIKFVTRFVPLIQFWTSLLDYSTTDTTIQTSDITILNTANNQPTETYFMQFKTVIMQKNVTYGQPPIKMGRAISLSRSIIDVVIKIINFTIPKSQITTQKERKKYVRKLKPVAATEISTDANEPNKELLSLDESSFRIAKGNFNKRELVKQFTYFQGRKIVKLASKTKPANPPVEKSNTLPENESAVASIPPPEVLSNALFKNFKIYCNLSCNVVVAAKKSIIISNKCFDTLNSESNISTSAMLYLTNTFPKKFKRCSIQPKMTLTLTSQKPYIYDHAQRQPLGPVYSRRKRKNICFSKLQNKYRN